MKAGWQTKSLGDVCKFQRGLTYSKKDEVDSSDNVVLRATNIDLESNQLDLSELKFISEKVAVPVAKKLQKDSLLICTASGSKSHLGKVAYIDDDYDYAFGGFMGMVTPSEALFPKYLFYLMTSGSYKDFIGQLSDGANINNLKFDDLKRFAIPFPSLPEQRRIVGILDEAFEGIAKAVANAEANLKNARELFESHLNAIFSNPGPDWVEKRLEEECEYLNGKAHEKCIDENGEFIVVNSKFISSDGKVIKKTNTALFPLFQGDIALVLSDVPKGKALAKCFLVDSDGRYTLNQRICVIRSNSFHKRFLYYQLNRNTHFLSFDNGENQTNLRKKDMLNCPLFIPPFQDQKCIADNLDSMARETKRLEAICRQKLALLAELKQSLLHKAFSGEL